MFRSASKHVHFALGVDPTARDAVKGGGSDLMSLASYALHSVLSTCSTDLYAFSSNQVRKNPPFIRTPPVS